MWYSLGQIKIHLKLILNHFSILKSIRLYKQNDFYGEERKKGTLNKPFDKVRFQIMGVFRFM